MKPPLFYVTYLHYIQKVSKTTDMCLIHFRIYYQASKDIYPGQELLINYGETYAKMLGVFEELELSEVRKVIHLIILV